MIKYLFLFFYISIQAQNLQIKGYVKDINNKSIPNASVLISDSQNNTISYIYTNENGQFNLQTEKNAHKIVVSCLGYQREEILLDTSVKNITIDVILKIKVQILGQITIEDRPVRKKGDTTTIKVNRFINQTEQTIEDVLKKIPGIEVQNDGRIKAHGKYIQKLLIEGDDIFDKGYQVLTKNLDARILDAVEILDNFEDNPILKKLTSSDKVAINLKVKNNKKNIWFGNINLGAGVVSENRWKESLNLGLLRKKIKLFFFSDYNNSGEKSTDLIQKSLIENNTFSEDFYEKRNSILYSINSNENTLFSKSQSINNKSFLNSLSLFSKSKENLTYRAQVYYTNDNQNQESAIETIYNTNSIPISSVENSLFNSNKNISGIDLEVKYLVNNKNYYTGNFKYNESPLNITNKSIFNNSIVAQNLKLQNGTFFAHLHHTGKISKKTILNNYFYSGIDKVNNYNKIISPLLNALLSTNNDSKVNQTLDNYLQYVGFKSKVLSKLNNFDFISSLNFENQLEKIYTTFLINTYNKKEFENKTQFIQNTLELENNFRYSFSKGIKIIASLNLKKILLEKNIQKSNFFLTNPTISVNYRSEKIGLLTIEFQQNNKNPQNNTLLDNPYLSSYNTFVLGMKNFKPIENYTYSIQHSILKDEKRFSMNSSITYLKTQNNIGFGSFIDQNFTFSNYNQSIGNHNLMSSFNFINYIKKLKVSVKLESNQNLNSSQIKVNSVDFLTLKNFSSLNKISGTTYFRSSFNLDFGLRYSFYQSEINSITTKNNIKDANLNLNFKASKELLLESNNNLYFLNNSNYTFLNLVVNYFPSKLKNFTFRLLCNNLTNQLHFTINSLENFTLKKSSIPLIPRYFLLNVKYRF